MQWQRLHLSAPVKKTNKPDITKKIIFFSRCLPKGDGDGGYRRTAQIAEALEGLDYTFVSAMDFYAQYHAAGYLASPQYQDYLSDSPIPQTYLEKWSPGRRNYIAYLHHVSWVWRKRIIDGHFMPKLAIVDDPIYFSPLVEFLSENSVPIVANCQNVESLSKSQIVEEHQISLLNFEINVLSLCCLAITISREETVLLRNLGVPTYYYPYFPVKGPYDRMLAIREKRKKTTKQDYLILGTAHNPPTISGMMNVIKSWKEVCKTMEDAKLFVGGFGSEPLKDLAGNEHVIYKGVLTDNELDELLSRVKACIVYQEDGSGALTKICEFILAGVPVLANPHAARSYYNVSGVYEFKDINGIARASRRVDNMETQTASLERPDAESLLMHITEIANMALDVRRAEVKGLDELRIIAAERDAIPSHRDALIQSLSRRLKRLCDGILMRN